MEYFQSAITVGAFWALLKFMVTDKLKVLESHDRRIRRHENNFAFLKGKGCLGDACPLAGDDEESDN